MDIATRFQPRVRAQEYLDRERNGMPDDSGGESESLPRRKFQRTEPVSDSNEQFRKPSLPASATRLAAPDRRPSLSNSSVRRRSTTMRENMRVPSGPREYPGGSPGKRFGSNNSGAPSVTETTNIPATRSFLPQINPGPAFGQNTELTRASFGNPTAATNTDDADSPLTPADRTNGNFAFLPPVNFDDFQSKLANFDEPSPLLSEFPTVGGGRALRKEEPGGMARGTVRPAFGKQQEQPNGSQEHGVGRSTSFKQRITGGSAAKPALGEGMASQGTAPTQSNISLRTRRQSTVPQSSTNTGQPLPTSTSRPPRKSVGPGLFSSLVDRKPSAQQPTSTAAEPTKASLARSSSLSRARRTTIQPSASAGAEVPRISTLTATTASRQAKVKSLQPPPREPDPNTPVGGRSPGKGNANNNRATTPTSSGNRRQSMAASGRASGLGARTISPTDTRRLKRLSMMQIPPMPTGMPKGPPTPQEELPAPRFPELPRLTQPSPNPAARKVSTASLTPTSARASPEPPRFGFNPNVSVPSLSSKSSYQSLQNISATTSRLPTPKTRNLHSSTAQYGEDNEIIPPVPMIPKAYESPRENETPFFSASRKSSATTFNEPTLNSLDSTNSLPAPNEAPPRSSFEAPLQTPRKTSHRRNQTIGSPDAVPKTATKPKQMPDAGGRRNNALQPLRLPPLNLLPLSSSVARNDPRYPKPSEELEDRDDYGTVQTPEPKRVPKTPSTPMTASKATFYRRQAEENAKQQVRSTTSHYALRDMMGFDESVTRFFEDSDPELPSNGIPMLISKQQQQARSAITPFASGSLPKQSGEFARLRGRPSGEYQEDSEGSGQGANDNARYQSSKPQGPRPRTSGTVSSYKTANTSVSGDSPVVEQAPQLPVEQKKEGGGLRRKLSLGWRRTSSKAANHPENKSSPQETPAEKERLIRSIPKPMEMPPPKLPASATWSGELPSLPSSARPSLDSLRRKSHAISAAANGAMNNAAGSDKEQTHATAQPKTRSLHSEQPQPVSVRSSSWGNFSLNNRAPAPRSATNGNSRVRQPTSSTSSISAIIKDKDDLAADDEMRRISQKRRDVDTAARESEALKARAVARSPMSPERVLHDRTAQLNIFERGEIVDYQKEGVYFTGTKHARKIIGSVTPSPSGDKEKAGNYGYDDERGDYNIVMGDHLAYRYEVVDLLGKGSFGQVVRCVDHREGGVVAIKIIRNKKRFHQQALVEVGILGRLRDWDPDSKYATLSITSSFYFRSHLCIVTPCLSINLYEFIRAHNFTGFPLPLIRRFSRQLLACLVLLQQKRIIHCDLKPENILLCEARKADVRVIDFGSSCREEEKVYTYIQSRFYRSPEVILGSSYGLGIDMWSFGCILAELWTGYPIFPGENEQEQLACIMEIFGPPDRHLVERCTRKKLFFDSVGKPRVTVSSKGRRRRPSSKTLQQALKTDDEAFIDFITRCLRWDPDRRLKPTEAINHPFITNQPMHQRAAGIPEEARRATSARVRSSAAVPTTTTTATVGGVPSPVKRVAGQGNAFAQQQQQQVQSATTARVRTTSETPLRANPATLQASPSKISLLSNPAGAASRRHSSINSVNGSNTSLPVGVAGSKRASNGAVLGSAAFGMPVSVGQKSGERPNLAAMAARESMRDVGANAGSGSGSAGGGGKAGWRM